MLIIFPRFLALEDYYVSPYVSFEISYFFNSQTLPTKQKHVSPLISDDYLYVPITKLIKIIESY